MAAFMHAIKSSITKGNGSEGNRYSRYSRYTRYSRYSRPGIVRCVPYCRTIPKLNIRYRVNTDDDYRTNAVWYVLRY